MTSVTPLHGARLAALHTWGQVTKLGKAGTPAIGWGSLYLCSELVEEVTLVSLPTQVLPDENGVLKSFFAGLYVLPSY